MKDSNKNRIIQIRASESEVEALDSAAMQTEQTRSELLRDSIPRLSSKGFDTALAMERLPALEKMASNFLDEVESGKIFQADEISDIAPAFILGNELCVKMPSIKLRVLELEQTDTTTLDDRDSFYKNLEAKYPQSYLNYEAGMLWPRCSEIVFFPQYYLLCNNLASAKELGEKMSTELNTHGRKVEYWPTYLLRKIPIYFSSDYKFFSTNLNAVKDL